jgi:hypothetical protein
MLGISGLDLELLDNLELLNSLEFQDRLDLLSDNSVWMNK